MDLELEKKIRETLETLSGLSKEEIDIDTLDPVVKMMLVALLGETKKIEDRVANVSQEVLDRYCSDFMPWEKVNVTPSLAIIAPRMKDKKGLASQMLEGDTVFAYKEDKGKTQLSFMPLFRQMMMTYSHVEIVTMEKNGSPMRNDGKVISGQHKYANAIWVGMSFDYDVESMKGFSLLIKGTGGVQPSRIFIASGNKMLDFATMSDMERVGMAEPFDAQQCTRKFLTCVEAWKECLLNMEDAVLVYIIDDMADRDVFKPGDCPGMFKQFMEKEELDRLAEKRVWLCVEFPEGLALTRSVEVVLNAVPVVNVEINSLSLTNASPIARLKKKDNSFFLDVLETPSAAQKEGFDNMEKSFIVRDFQAACYRPEDLFRDVRQLYHRFVDDYYAFMEYHDIKDGESLRQLREALYKIGEATKDKNPKNRLDNGIYVMKNLKNETSTVKVGYLTTNGEEGNRPREGEFMENKKLPFLEQKAEIVVCARGGTDMAGVDERYELLRYFTMTNDRLYTKMDIDAFVRKELMAEYGKVECKRIFSRVEVEGVGGSDSVQRGVYVYIDFKDNRNFKRADDNDFDDRLRQRIINRSCISMPVVVRLTDMEESK